MTDTTPETARLTADIALFSEDEDGQTRVLVIKRRWNPFEGHWALPGGHVDAGEEVSAAAHRELAEETGLSARALDFVGVYAAPGRDPRGRYATFAYTARMTGMPEPAAGDDAADAEWVPVDELLASGNLAFDHAAIIRDARRIAL
jgi:8-oxo-dGTP diphosphatase